MERFRDGRARGLMWERVLARLAAWVRPGGRVVFVEYDRRAASRPPTEHVYWTEDLIFIDLASMDGLMCGGTRDDTSPRWSTARWCGIGV